MKAQTNKRKSKLFPATKSSKSAKAKAQAAPKPSRLPGKSGPRLDDEQRDLLRLALVAGLRESSVHSYFEAMGWERLSSSTLAYYRKLWAREMAKAKAARIDAAMTTGLALKAERIAALKDHAELLSELRFVADRKTGRLWNERAWRQTLEDIAIEMGDRKPKDGASEQAVKVYVGIDPDKV